MARAQNVSATWIFETKTWLVKLPGLKVEESTRGATSQGVRRFDCESADCLA